MKYKKTLEELTLKDNFMFCAVMTMEENCRSFLEICLGFPIGNLEVDREKSMIWHPEYKSIRLDVYAKDDENRRYNVEMQVASRPDLASRKRYYQSQMDRELLLAGHAYTELPDTYVIFVCDFDPVGRGKYLYTFENCCLEDGELKLNDGCRSLFLSTHGKNSDEVPAELVKFLEYLQAGEEGRDVKDAFVERLQASVHQVKTSREMEGRFMTLQEIIQDERAEAREEGKNEGKIEGKTEMILAMLNDVGSIPKGLEKRILRENDEEVLKEWTRLAARVDSIQQFADALR